MSDDVADAFASLLREARNRRGVSQEELAYLAGLDRSAVSKMERGRASPRLETILRLAGSLGIDPAELLPALRWRPPADAPMPAGRFVKD